MKKSTSEPEESLIKAHHSRDEDLETARAFLQDSQQYYHSQ
jgi:hypothetical protein